MPPRDPPHTAPVWTSIERRGQDVRYAGRLLRRRPVLSATAILTLMLGMGGTTAVFSLMNALLLRQLPVERPEGTRATCYGATSERACTCYVRTCFTC